MRYSMIILAAVILMAGMAGMVMLLRSAGDAKTLEKPMEPAARPQPMECKLTEGSKLKDFNLSFELKLPGTGDRARVMVNAADEKNAYTIDIAGDGVTFGSLESGVGRTLCHKSGLKPASATPHEVLIKRRTPELTLVVDGEQIASVQDETHAYGKVGFGLESPGGSIDKVKMQPVADIYFADNFMQDAAEKSGWTQLRGKWEVNVVSNPTMSANAFDYRVEAKDAGSSVTGETFWDNYAFRTSVRSVDGRVIGVYLYYRDEKNYYLFTWDQRDDKNPAEAHKRLVKMHDGKRTVLAEAAGGFLPNQWYVMEVEASGDRLRAYIDDHLVFAVKDENLVGGLVGLYAEKTGETRFDDVFVRTVKTYRDDMAAFPGGDWTVLGGTWRTEEASKDSGSVVVESKGGSARSVTGSRSWRNYVVNTEMEPGNARECGVNFCYLDETAFYALGCVRGQKGDVWQLVKRQGGKDEVLARKETSLHRERYMVSASANRGRISVNVDGALMLETFDRTLGAGAVALWAQGGDATRFVGLAVDFPRETVPLLAENEVFEHERSMSEWSGLDSNWAKIDVDGRAFYWHQGSFPGTSTLEVKVDQFDKPTSVLEVVLNGDGKTTVSGYRSTVGPAKGQTQAAVREAVLYRLNQEVARQELPPGSQPVSVTLERMGNLLVTFVNGEAVIHWRDEEPLTGDRLGWSATACKVNSDELVVRSPNVYQETFNQAPAQWRTFGGAWEITYRWECDKRWSFFSGKSKTNELAVLWSKRLFAGDTTVEFYIGPKMNQAKGNAYQYAGDFNCVLNADGKDLTSGYSFLIGGFDDTKSCIYRKTAMVGKASSVIIPRESRIHRQWLHVQAQNKGGKLSLWLDGKLLAEYADPNPLTGDRFAVWTYNNGIMLARMVISCEDGTRMEEPDFAVPGKCRSVYDPELKAER